MRKEHWLGSPASVAVTGAGDPPGLGQPPSELWRCGGVSSRRSLGGAFADVLLSSRALCHGGPC